MCNSAPECPYKRLFPQPFERSTQGHQLIIWWSQSIFHIWLWIVLWQLPDRLPVWISSNTLVSINVVTLCQARLVAWWWLS